MVMGKAKPGKADGARCRRHQRNRQQGAGVCACCLRERLAHLSLSASSSLPSVVRGGEEESDERCYDDEEAGSSCSEASTAYSSEGSSAASSGCGSPGEPAFHDEMRRAARVSLLMRHERVVGDADAVVEFLRARREEQRRRTASSFWAKLLHATRGGGKKEDACSLAARGAKAIEERGAAAKWVLF